MPNVPLYEAYISEFPFSIQKAILHSITSFLKGSIMTNIVLLCSAEQQQSIQHFYKDALIERKAPGVIFAVKLSDTAITAYKSGKVMFQGAGAEREAARWGQAGVSPAKIASTKGDTLPDNFAALSVLGSDETGTGDYFGPVTVAAVYVPADKIALVQELGVKDSKQLTDDYMRQIAPDLMKVCAHSILTLRNDKYNAIQSRGYSQGKIKAPLHNRIKACIGENSTRNPAIYFNRPICGARNIL